MPQSPGPITTVDPVGVVMEALSIVLLVIFLATALTTALPPMPLNPPWQLALIAVLINNGSLALVGALLTPLALAFNPESDRLRARRHAFRRWALAASLGYLLLIPLQASAGWRLYSRITTYSEQQNSQSGQKLAELRQSISTAATPEELQAKLQTLFGNNVRLTTTQRRTPIQELRQELLAKTNLASIKLQQRIESQSAMKPDQLVKDTIRITISALAYAAGFAFLGGALPRSGKRPLSRLGFSGEAPNPWVDR
jgi:hypothetical protein